MNFHALKVLLTGTILLAIVGCSGSSSDSGVSSGTFAKSIDVFGVNVAGKACVGDDKLLYAAPSWLNTWIRMKTVSPIMCY